MDTNIGTESISMYSISRMQARRQEMRAQVEDSTCAISMCIYMEIIGNTL